MRDLPPLNALRAFVAAGRLGGFKQAAESLSVTPTAVSHQVRRLEEHLGLRLFRRLTRRTVLTAEGEALLAVASEALDAIGREARRLRRRRGPEVVTVALGPIVGSRWLTPRLSRLWAEHPGLELRLHHAQRRIDFDRMDADLAIAYGDGQWRGFRVDLLMRIELSPVLSPSLGERMGSPRCPQDLLRYPLIHQRDHRDWRAWFAAAGVAPPVAERGAVMEDANMVHQAALQGQGVALGIPAFIQDDLTAGRLLRPFDRALEPDRAYYLLRRPGSTRGAAAAVSRWLLAEAAAG